jgi:hypothetical protein
VEAVKVEAACSSGGIAFREGYLAVASGQVNFALVCGVEKMLDHPGEEITEGLVSASDADWESAMGDTFVAINARLMQRYMHEYGVKHEDFALFPINSHHNAVNNPNAMLRYELSKEQFNKARMIADRSTCWTAHPCVMAQQQSSYAPPGSLSNSAHSKSRCAAARGDRQPGAARSTQLTRIGSGGSLGEESVRAGQVGTHRHRLL